MNIRYILCALGGASVGAGITALIFKKRIDKIEAEHKAITENTVKVAKEVRYKAVDALDNFADYGEATEAALKEAEHYKKLYYDILRKDYNDTQNEVPEDPVTLENPEEESGAEMEAYAITVADFMDDVRYNKVYCEYYRETDSLVDTSTETEIDARQALGEMIELLPGWVGTEMYIRNTRTNTDYQIDFLPGPFGGGD